ncbi:FAD-binding oxidoreductase [Uruburuella testudinis]|uniref:D-amino-acid oxidase n=1 Tax=Uruburuella testudinis TaxID=1282863 RepID=A0ABY4DVD0_9NEIS|nr:FAD-dependent oxidoreductase [Uruburuella testudinis]UOO81969.1 FAD-binding oxidoreductase [Uruburuella testudinis]
MPRIAILGGGLSGRLTALQLAGQGFQTALFDSASRAGEQSAAYVAAAMLAPLAESVEATPEVIALGRQSLPLWRTLLGRLNTPVFMQQQGSLIVWHGQDKPLAVQFEQHLHRAAAAPAAEHWQAAQIAAGEPQLAGRFQAALYLPGEGQLDNRQVLDALADALDRAGVDCHWHSPVETADVQASFDWVVDCRGFGAKAAWNRPSETPDAAKLRGVRGEVARVYAPEITLNRPVRLLHPRYPLYIAPKQNHVFVIGATQIESESQAPAGVRSGLELLSALYAVHPAFGEAQILELAANLRPTLNHHNPEIRYCRTRRLVEINGLFRHGFMIAPAVTAAAVRLVAALSDNREPPPADQQSGLPYLTAP